MRRLARTALALAAAAVLVAAPGPATAAEPEPWQPYVEGTLNLPADRYCGDFDLRSTPVQQDIKSRVLDRYASGAPRTMEFTGLLLIDVTNLSTGETVRRDVSGRAYVTFREDGSFETYEMQGPIGLGWPQDDGYERGFYVVHGHHVIAWDESGHRTAVVDDGIEENLCATLA